MPTTARKLSGNGRRGAAAAAIRGAARGSSRVQSQTLRRQGGSPRQDPLALASVVGLLSSDLGGSDGGRFFPDPARRACRFFRMG